MGFLLNSLKCVSAFFSEQLNFRKEILSIIATLEQVFLIEIENLPKIYLQCCFVVGNYTLYRYCYLCKYKGFWITNIFNLEMLRDHYTLPVLTRS